MTRQSGISVKCFRKFNESRATQKKARQQFIKSRTSNKLHKFGDPIFLNHFVFYSSIYV